MELRIVPTDYTKAAGTLTFAPGETTKTFAVPILDDTRDEPDGGIKLTLSGATGVAINSGTAGTLNVTGSVTANNAAAVVFAPGGPLQAQPRDAAYANSIASYLDGSNAKGAGTYGCTRRAARSMTG